MTSPLSKGVTRRTFLQTAAAAGVVAGTGAMSALAGCSTQEAAQAEEEQVFQGLCFACEGCPLDVHVRGNNIVQVNPTDVPGGDDLKRFCARGSSLPYQYVMPRRTKYPMKRTTWSADNPQGELRGRGEWERISWDEAIQTIADELTAIQREYGKESVCMFQYGAVESRFLWNVNRLQNVAGFSDQNRTTDMALSQAGMYGAGTFAYMSYGYELMLAQLKCLVVWGHNPCVAWPQDWHFIADAIEKNGCRLVVIDPNYNTIASKADLYVSVRPGSDGALAFGMMNYVEAQGWANDEWMRTKSCASYLVNQATGMYLRRSDVEENVETDEVMVWDEDTDSLMPWSAATRPALRKQAFAVGDVQVAPAYTMLMDIFADYTLDRTAEITSVPVETIKQVVQYLHDNTPADIQEGFGLDHYTTGFNNMMAVVALRIQLGTIPAPDSAFSLNQSGFAATETEHPVKGRTLSTFMFNDLVEKGECVLPDGLNTTITLPLHGLLAFGGDIVNSCADQNRTIEAYKKLDFIAVVNKEWSDTAEYADIVLPACYNEESHDIDVIDSCVLYVEQAVEPKFESKSDFDICALIGTAMGYGEWFTEDIYQAMEHTLDNGYLGYMKGITYEQLKQQKIIRIDKMDLPYSMNGDKPTFYLESMYPFTYFGQNLDLNAANCHLPYWQPPVEAWKDDVPGYPKSEAAEKYPLHVISGTRRFRVHSYYGLNPALREMEINEPCVRVNPDDAAARGIADGDHVRLYNDRGEAVMKALYSAGIRPGELDADRGWHRTQYIKGCAQALSMKTITNWACPNYAYHDALCEMEKWNGTTEISGIAEQIQEA